MMSLPRVQLSNPIPLDEYSHHSLSWNVTQGGRLLSPRPVEVTALVRVTLDTLL